MNNNSFTECMKQCQKQKNVNYKLEVNLCYEDPAIKDPTTLQQCVKHYGSMAEKDFKKCEIKCKKHVKNKIE